MARNGWLMNKLTQHRSAFLASRKFLYLTLDHQAGDLRRLPSIVSGLLTILILLSVSSVILSTVDEIDARLGPILTSIERVCLVVFSVEYIARIWASSENPEFGCLGPVRGRLKYAISPMALIDLMAIAPALILVTNDALVLRLLRLLRLMRLAKLGRHMEALRMLGCVVHRVKYDLAVTVILASMLLVVSSSLVYIFESNAQPDTFSSIPAALWWGVATLTTVGYGDVYPITPLGRIFGALVAMTGVALFALPAGIMGSAYVEELRRKRHSGRNDICPACGQPRSGGVEQ